MKKIFMLYKKLLLIECHCDLQFWSTHLSFIYLNGIFMAYEFRPTFDEALFREIVEKVTVWDPANEAECIDAAKQAAFGITYATVGIAETGTVLQPSSPKCGRSISLLPLAHIAVVDAATIVGTMADALKPYNEGELPMPGQLCFISGPSATADIELVRVEGVHGPMYVHYIVVE